MVKRHNPEAIDIELKTVIEINRRQRVRESKEDLKKYERRFIILQIYLRNRLTQNYCEASHVVFIIEWWRKQYAHRSDADGVELN